jgi:FkbH-like protein
LQRYAKSLMRRGVVLAVCSKNDEANALLPFEQHPEMELKREDIACFVANWEDKATNLRHIANTLKLGLDSLVFVDDSPAERGLVRRELPVVAVPEMPVDPADYVRVLASAGYFEGVCVTAEDRERAEHYAANVRRNSAAVQSATDLPAYLSGLRMELEWRSFSAADRVRIVQLINKTNQFNLTTRRRSETEVERLTTSDEALTLQFRLKDIYGDNGMIGVIVAEPITEMEKLPGIKFGQHDLLVSTWLMSCRVLGRQVDEAMMNVLAEQARNRGVLRLFATYVPTAKNEMVREHYARMGFSALGASADGTTWWGLDIPSFQPRLTPIVSRELSASS